MKKIAWAALAAVLLAPAGRAQQEHLVGSKGRALAIGETVPDLQLADDKGAKHSIYEGVGKGDVLVIGFYSCRCPYNKAFWGRIAKLSSAYGKKGVKFLGVNPNKKETLEEVRKSAADAGISGPVYRDDGHAVSDALGAQATPHMLVIDANRVLRYRGAVDDSGGNRKEPKVPHLKLALDAVLGGRRVPETEPDSFIGCSIKR